MERPGTSDPTHAGGVATGQDRQPGDPHPAAPALNFWAVFESAPDAYLLLAPDPPHFTMVAANEARLRATLTRREDVIGRPLFEVFPDNPDDPAATGVRNLLASLDEVIRTGKPHRMALQKYDIRTPGGTFEERYWDPLNSPVFDDRGDLIYIIHRVEDVTGQVLSDTRLRILENVVTTANDAVMVTEPGPLDGTGPRIIYVNAAFTRMTGYAPDEVIGRTTGMLLGPDSDQETVERIRAALQLREPVRAELLNYRKDGNAFCVEVSITPVLDERGAVVQWTSVQRDTTERREAQETALRLARETAARAEAERAHKEIASILERLRESEERFRALGNSIPQLAWMADPRGWIFWYNERWHEYTGTTPEEMQGRGWRKVQHPDHADRVVERIQHSFATGEPWEDTFPLRSRTGEYRWFLSRAVPIRDEHGTVVRWFGTNTDITAEIEAAAERERLLEGEREARAEAERRREELERVTESRTRLMRGFSHDVKNPLGAADGYAQLLEEGLFGDLSPKQQDSIGRIRRSIRTALRLIHDLLELARAEAGQLEIECVATDVTHAALEVAEDFRAQAAAVGLALDVRAPQGLRADTDPTRLRQILANLLSNAVKYAPNGQATVNAEVRGDGGPRAGEWIAVHVADTGPGIPADKRQQIFQEFSRLDPGAQQGAGVGLAISRRIARLMGGELTVESEIGRGSTFTLWLPPAPSDDTEPLQRHGTAGTRRSAPSHGPAPAQHPANP
jgi:PAS domain S-box-containing protein